MWRSLPVPLWSRVTIADFRSGAQRASARRSTAQEPAVDQRVSLTTAVLVAVTCWPNAGSNADAVAAS